MLATILARAGKCAMEKPVASGIPQNQTYALKRAQSKRVIRSVGNT